MKLFNEVTLLDMLLKRYAHKFEVLIFAGYKSEIIEDHIQRFYSKSSVNIEALIEDDLQVRRCICCTRIAVGRIFLCC